MTRILATLAALVIAALTAIPATAFTGLGLDQIESEAYKVDSRGTDFRVYEFTPKGRPDMLCIAMFSQAGGGDLECYANGGAGKGERRATPGRN